MNSADNIKEAYLTAFEAAAPLLPGQDTKWLKALRTDAIEQFSEQGFPGRKQEAWRYTNMTPLVQQHFALPESKTASQPQRLAGGGPVIRVENGRLRMHEEGREMPGMRLSSFREMLASEPDKVRALLARTSDGTGEEAGTGLLNRAFMSDGLVLEIDENYDPSNVIEIQYDTNATAPVAHHVRNLVLLAAGARATLVEYFSGQGPYWNNLVTDIDLATKAEFTHIIRQEEGTDAVHIGLRRARLQAQSRLESFVLSTGGHVARDELHMDFAGEGATAEAAGVFLAGGRQCRDTYILTDHRVPGTSSNQYFKGVMADRARGAFQGRIVVQEGAAGTDAHQTCNNLILDRGAEANAKPELLIHADDVKCSHGATVGELDADALFYLMARGLTPADAKSLLVNAFAADALRMVKDEALRAVLEQAVTSWMKGHMGTTADTRS